jgi:hypothetical protein
VNNRPNPAPEQASSTALNPLSFGSLGALSANAGTPQCAVRPATSAVTGKTASTAAMTRRQAPPQMPSSLMRRLAAPADIRSTTHRVPRSVPCSMPSSHVFYRGCMTRAAGTEPLGRTGTPASGRQPADVMGGSRDQTDGQLISRRLDRLATQPFRARFHLAARDVATCRARGRDTIAAHAADLIAARLAPAAPYKDGKQTPYRGHPVFVAQHASATCCRTCLARWHHIPAGCALTADQQRYVVAVILAWLDRELATR